jgi:hypothetical protein
MANEHYLAPRILAPNHVAYSETHNVLDTLPRTLWTVLQLAQHSEKQWQRLIAKGKRHQTDHAKLAWLARLGDVYWRIFSDRIPQFGKGDGPFPRFVEAAQQYVLRASYSFVDDEAISSAARANLAHFKPNHIAAFVKEHYQELAGRWGKLSARKRYTPDLIKSGIFADSKKGRIQ